MDNAGITEDQLAQLQERAAAQQAVSSSGSDEKDDDALVDVEEVKDRIRKALRGTETKWVEVDGDQGVYQQIEVDPDDSEKLCNEKAIQEINRTIEGSVNTNVSGSFFSGKDVEYAGAMACYAIAEKIYVNQEEYDIDGPADASQIMSIVANNLKGSIRKAKGGRLMKHREQNVEIREVRRGQNEDDGGRMDWLPV